MEGSLIIRKNKNIVARAIFDKNEIDKSIYEQVSYNDPYLP